MGKGKHSKISLEDPNVRACNVKWFVGGFFFSEKSKENQPNPPKPLDNPPPS